VKLAVSPSVPNATADALVDLCREAEALGYAEAWLAEVAGPEAFALAGAIAAATERMPIGVAVVAAANRTPALLAMGAATVSQVGKGRPIRLGIGSSSQVIVEQWHGKSFARPLRQVREAVEATRAALSGEPTYLGETVRMERFRLGSPPAGRVDLYVGALGPRMLQLAGAVGDGVCLNLMPAAAVPRQLAEIVAGAAAAGRDLPADFGVMARFHCVVDADLDRARTIIRGGFGPYFAQPVYNRFLAWCGYPEEAAAIATAWAERDREGVAAAFHDEVVDAVALVGPPPAIRERLEEFGEAGVGIAALNILSTDLGSPVAALRALAPG
jgi:probable F420-dependent oxidoreductase